MVKRLARPSLKRPNPAGNRVLRQTLRNKTFIAGSILLVLLVVMVIFGDHLAAHSADQSNLLKRLHAPSREHILGADHLGRDVLARVLAGARTSLMSGALVVLVSGLFGGAIGITAGYYGRHIDKVLMRCVDFLLAFPAFLLAMTIVAILGPGLRNAIIALIISYTGPFARLMRGATVKAMSHEFVEAAHSLGARNPRIIFRHVVPAVMAPAAVQLALSFGASIVDLAGLSFLGLGAQPPLPEWGAMLSEGRPYISTAWWVTTFPGVGIVLTVLAFTFIGDGLRDAVDPKSR